MLEVRDLRAQYGQVQVLRGLDLTVHNGKCLAILGRNGAGKTTLAKSLMGYGPKASGQIVLDGCAISGLPTHRRARRGMQLVPEDRRIYTGLSVRENLRLARTAAPGGHSMSEEEVISLLPMLGRLIDRQGRELSGGEQQLVAIARAAVASPKLLIMDEPTEGLAPVIVDEVRSAVRSLLGQDVAIVLVEQNVRFALDVSNDVIILGDGVVQLATTPIDFDFESDVVLRHLVL